MKTAIEFVLYMGLTGFAACAVIAVALEEVLKMIDEKYRFEKNRTYRNRKKG